jgi:hypothetical protein
MSESLYDLLGLELSASDREIKRAFRYVFPCDIDDIILIHETDSRLSRAIPIKLGQRTRKPVRLGHVNNQIMLTNKLKQPPGSML